MEGVAFYGFNVEIWGSYGNHEKGAKLNLNDIIKPKLRKLVQVEDFKENSLLRLVAEKDLKLAMQLVDEFNGLYEYIPIHTWVYRNAIRRYIHGERDKIKSTKTLARELGTSTDYIRRLLRSSKHLLEALPEPPA